MDLIVLIFVVAAAAVVGFLLGFLVRALTSQGTDSGKVPDSKQPSSAKKAPRRNLIEVANLWRDQRDGRLIFQIEDQYFKRGDELTTREREILLKVVMDFYRWLEPSSAIPPRSKESGEPGITTVSKPGGEISSGILPSEIRRDVSLQEPASLTQEIQPLPGVVSRAISATITPPDTPAPSVVAQVNSILQEKLHAANMQKWAVRITETPNQGMIVWVGMERYEAIDDVPYKRVRGIIRESVAEWERRAETDDTVQ